MILRALAVLLFWVAGVQAEPLRIGTESDFRPYIFLQDGQRRGYDADLMDLICTSGGFSCQWIEAEFDQLFTGVAEGRFDIAIGGIGHTPDRDRLVDWTRPYRVLSSGTSVFAGLKDDLDVTTLRIGVQGETVQEQVLRDNGYRVALYPSHQAMLQALFAGEITVIFATPAYFERLVEAGETRLFNLGALDYPDDGPQIAVAKSKPQLRHKLDQIIERLRAAGDLTLIGAKWFPETKASNI